MAWTSGDFEGPLTARAAVAFVFGEELAQQHLLDAVRDRDVVYAAVRSEGAQEVWGLVLVISAKGSAFTSSGSARTWAHTTFAARRGFSICSPSRSTRWRVTGALAAGREDTGSRFEGKRSSEASTRIGLVEPPAP